MVGKVIYNLLTTSTELTALISNKVFPLISEDETIINYIVYERRSTQPTNTKLKRSTVDVISYDIMIFTDGLEIMNDIALGVRNALDQYKGVNSGLWIDNIVYTGENDEYEPESNVFGKFMSFDVRFNNIYSTLKQPTNLTTTATSTEITLNWDDNATGETGYKVYRSTNLRDYELITSLGGGIETYEDTDVVIDTVYYYFIVPYNSVGNGYASDVVADKLGGGTAPDGEFYINLVKVADVPSGGNASTIVTLDGVSAGTYDSINNIWEVVSNPCSDATYTIKDRDETTLYSGSIVSGGNLNQYIENTTVEVNDTSFADVPAQGYLNIPVEYENGTPVGTINAGVVEIPNPITQSGIAYQRPSLTGQITSYRTGDDGWNLANGIYNYTPPTYPTSFAKLDLAAVSPFTTLLHNNAFGNKNRFTDDSGGQTYANDYVIDHLTGLGYYRIVQGASNNWDTNIDNAVASTQGGFTDWRVCNFQEYDIIADRSMVAFNYSPFNLTGSPISVFQTSTTRNDTTTYYIRYQITTFVQSVSELKSTALSSRGVLYCRNHY